MPHPDAPKILIRRKEVERQTSLSRSRIYALMQEGLFPSSVSLGPMSVAWVESEIQAWIATRLAEFRQSDEGQK
jgi:prophage regulatory protein